MPVTHTRPSDAYDPYLGITVGTNVRRRRPFAVNSYSGAETNSDLVEGSRTNIITFSEDLNQNVSPHWSFQSLRINASNTQVIRGINFNKIELNVSGASNFRTIQTFAKTTTASTNHAASIHVKKQDYDLVSFRIEDGIATAQNRVDWTYTFSTDTLSTPAITQRQTSGTVQAGIKVQVVNAVDYTTIGGPALPSVGDIFTTSITATMPSGGSLDIRQLGTSFTATREIIDTDLVRVCLTFATDGSTSLKWVLFPSVTSQIPDTQAGQGTWFGGAQIEVGKFCSTYIKTLASSVTRAADVLTVDFTGVLVGNTIPATFTLVGAYFPYGGFVFSDGDSATPTLFRAATPSNDGIIIHANTGVTASIRQSSDNAQKTDITTTWTLATGSPSTFAFRGNGTEVESFINGVGTGSPTAYDGTLKTVTTANIGSTSAAASREVFGYNLQLLFTRALSNDEILTIHNSLTLG